MFTFFREQATEQLAAMPFNMFMLAVSKQKFTIELLMKKAQPKNSGKKLINQTNNLLKSVSILSLVLISVFRITVTLLCLVIIFWIFTLPNWRELGLYLVSSQAVEYARIWSWPLIALIALIVLRAKIPDMLKRGFKLLLPFGGLEVGPEQQSLTPPSASDTDKLLPEDKDPKEAEPTSAEDPNQTELTLATTKKTDEPKTSKGMSKENFEKVIDTKDEAITFERANGIIYFSQIRLLETLASYPDGLNKGDDLQPYYEYYKFRAGAGPMLKVVYLQFLTSWGFAEYNPVKGVYKITDFGRRFLKYRTANSLELPNQNKEL